MGSRSPWVVCGDREVVWMVQVRALFRVRAVRAARADSSRFQLAALYRVVSTCRSHRSLCRPFRLVSHPYRRRRHRSGAPIRRRHLPVRLPHPNGLLAYFLDVARSFRRRARS